MSLLVSLPLKPFYMIRHGETEANAARIMAGNTETPLTAKGIAQAENARQVVEKLAIKPVAIFHSHLSRARDTAAIINKNLRLPMFEDADLGEKHSGILEGAPYEKCLEEFNNWIDIEGGETANDFFSRIKRGKTKALERFNEPVLIVCHGGVMRGFGKLYDINVPGRFENAHLYEFTPLIDHPVFPWDVYDYRLCKETGALIKNPAEIYFGK